MLFQILILGSHHKEINNRTISKSKKDKKIAKMAKILNTGHVVWVRSLSGLWVNEFTTVATLIRGYRLTPVVVCHTIISDY